MGSRPELKPSIRRERRVDEEADTQRTLEAASHYYSGSACERATTTPARRLAAAPAYLKKRTYPKMRPRMKPTTPGMGSALTELVAPRPAMKTTHSVPSRSTTEKARMKMAYLLRPASACGGARGERGTAAKKGGAGEGVRGNMTARLRKRGAKGGGTTRGREGIPPELALPRAPPRAPSPHLVDLRLQLPLPLLLHVHGAQHHERQRRDHEARKEADGALEDHLATLPVKF